MKPPAQEQPKSSSESYFRDAALLTKRANASQRFRHIPLVRSPVKRAQYYGISPVTVRAASRRTVTIAKHDTKELAMNC